MTNGKEGARTTVILVRHGECSANKEERFRGRADFDLNELGFRQAEEIAPALAKLAPTALYSSPLKRALQSMAPAARLLGLPVGVEEGLTNVSLGSWEGELKSEIAARFPDLWALWKTEPEKLAFPGMEPLSAVGERSRRVLDDLASRHRGETIAVVTHRTVLKPLVACCLSVPAPWFWKFHFDTGSLSILTFEPDRGWSLFSLNRIDHLTALNREWN